MPQPNVLFIITDQQRPDTIAHLGHEHVCTPNLDRLAQAGVSLTNAYVQSTVCVPSRACILSSQYVHTHGAADNGRWIREDETNWVSDFTCAGYRTVCIGKMHAKPVDHPCGFRERWVVENKNHDAVGGYDDDDYSRWLQAEHGVRRPALDYPETVPDWYGQLGATVWPLADELFQDNVVGERAAEVIAQHDFATPLFLHAGFSGPHDPFDVPQSDLDAFGDREIPEPVATEGELEHKPSPQREYMEMMEELKYGASIPLLSRGTPAKIERMRRHYFANIMTIDRQVGRLLQALEDRDQLDNTVVVFISDHGDALGDHHMLYKFANHYESVVKVPCIFAGPGIPADRVEPGLVESIDFGPTLLELCGVRTDQAFAGRSLGPLLQRGETVHDVVFSEYSQRLMVRRHNWKMVFYTECREGELYDLDTDPDELHNRFDDPAVVGVRDRLFTELERWQPKALNRAED